MRRPRGSVARDGRQLETAAFTCETAYGGWSQPPSGGLASEAREVEVPGVLCGFHPRMMDAAKGVGLGAAGSWKLRPSWGETAGAVRCSPARGLGK